MLRALRDFFDQHIAPAPGRDDRHTIEVATAALLVEALSAHERHLIRKVAALLHVPDADDVAAQARARDGRGGTG